MEQLSGLGKKDRERLSAVLRGSKGTITVRETASILKTTDSVAAKNVGQMGYERVVGTCSPWSLCACAVGIENRGLGDVGSFVTL